MGLLDRLVRGSSATVPFMADPFMIRETDLDLSAISHRSSGPMVGSAWSSHAAWPSTEMDTLVKDAAIKAVTVYACVNALAKSVAEAPLRVYRETPDTTDDDEVDTDHPAHLLLSRPNPRHSAYRFIYVLVKTAALAGYVVVEKVRDKRTGEVVELWPLRPEYLKVKPQDQAEPRWEYKVPGRSKITLEPEDVIVIPFDEDVASPHTGLSPVKVVMRQVGLEDAADNFLKLLIESGGVPPFVLEANGPATPGQVEQIQRTWKEKYQGARKGHELPVLHSGFKVVKTGMNLEEMLFPDLRSLTEIKICQGFGVPGIMVQAVMAYEHSTYSNAGEWREQFVHDTVAPLWRRFADSLTADLLREFDEDPALEIRFDTSKVMALQEDQTKRYERATRALQAGGMKLNTFLRLTGQEQVTGDLGEAFFLPFNVVPTLADGRVVETAAPVAQRSQPVPTITELPPESLRALSTAATRHVRRDDTLLSTRELERRASVARTQSRTLRSLTNRLAPELMKFWRGQADRIIPVITRSLEADIETRDAAEVDWLEEERRLAEVLMRFYSLAGETAYRVAGELLSLDIVWDVGNTNVRRVLRELGLNITGIADTTRTQVQDAIGAGVKDGKSLDDISKDLRKLITETYRDRAYVIARTESKDAYGMASELAYAESGQVDEVEIRDNAGHTDRYDGAADGLTCAERNGIIVATDQMSFHIRSDHPNGSAFGIPIVKEAAA